MTRHKSQGWGLEAPAGTLKVDRGIAITHQTCPPREIRGQFEHQHEVAIEHGLVQAQLLAILVGRKARGVRRATHWRVAQQPAHPDYRLQRMLDREVVVGFGQLVEFAAPVAGTMEEGQAEARRSAGAAQGRRETQRDLAILARLQVAEVHAQQARFEALEQDGAVALRERVVVIPGCLLARQDLRGEVLAG
ncbi:MAG: hypothetical protein U1F23_12385 [Lysobacterales bacterium]